MVCLLQLTHFVSSSIDLLVPNLSTVIVMLKTEAYASVSLAAENMC